MRLWIGRGLAAGLFLAGLALFGLDQGGGGSRAGEDEVLPHNGKNQKDYMARIEHRQNLKDAADLTELAEQRQIEPEKNDRYVVSMATIENTDIEKLAKKIRSRLRHN